MSRQLERKQFLALHGLREAQITPLVPDASARRYFRLNQGNDTLMLMDAPPPGEKPGAFVQVTSYLEKLGARVPHVFASDLQSGLVLIEDLGDQTMTRLLAQGADETTLYQQAVDALVKMQRAFPTASAEINLPAYDLDAAVAEADLMVEWYLPARLMRRLDQAECKEFREIWTCLFRSLPAMPQVLVHRDFHVDNLLIVEGACAMLDYQDALLGSPLYDLVSLLEDARRDVDVSLQQQLIEQWQATQNIDQETFTRHFTFWGAQRHCKVAGIFIRLWLRDHKNGYLDHLPRVMDLLKRNLEPAFMAPLKDWLSTRLPEIAHQELGNDPDTLRRIVVDKEGNHAK